MPVAGGPSVLRQRAYTVTCHLVTRSLGDAQPTRLGPPPPTSTPLETTLDRPDSTGSLCSIRRGGSELSVGSLFLKTYGTGHTEAIHWSPGLFRHQVSDPLLAVYRASTLTLAVWPACAHAHVDSADTPYTRSSCSSQQTQSSERTSLDRAIQPGSDSCSGSGLIRYVVSCKCFMLGSVCVIWIWCEICFEWSCSERFISKGRRAR